MRKITKEDILEKENHILYHASNVHLKQQYRECKFNKYSKLIYYLLVIEKNNKMLLKIHKFRPTSYTPFPEVNEISFGNYTRNNGRGQRSDMNN